ncbi:MAG: hypothetical protein ACFB4J_11915 [Elainellaceae cyanobacterium]
MSLSHIPPDKVVDAARRIRPELADLLPTDAAAAFDQQLAGYLARANAGEAVHEMILELLRSDPETEDWLLEIFSPTRSAKGGYQALPGGNSAIGALEYICPQGNDYTYFLRSVGSAIPLCPTHGCSLVPASSGSSVS